MLAVPKDQVNLIQEYFAKRIEKLVKDQQKESNMKLTVVMINLRNSERFFTLGNEIRNVSPGTLINSEIVSKFYDFYIVSQTSNRGSIVPNHYTVIYSSSKIE